jgi:DNA polymerase-3 subunit beta
MKVSLLSENILEKLLLVNHAVSSRSQLPILLNFLIKTEKKTLSISGTDLEIGIKIEIPANVEEEGETTVPAKTFSELLGTVSTGKITLETTPAGLTLTGKGLKTVFQTTKTEEFPKLYEDTGEEAATISRKEIEKNFPRVVFAASQDQTRPALSGVLIVEKKRKKVFLWLQQTDIGFLFKKSCWKKKGKRMQAD